MQNFSNIYSIELMLKSNPKTEYLGLKIDMVTNRRMLKQNPAIS